MSGKPEFFDWPEVLRVLLAGTGLINNLVEPSIQLEELERELPRLQRWLEGAVPEDLQEVIKEELVKQAEYLGNFASQFARVFQQLEALTKGGKRIDLSEIGR